MSSHAPPLASRPTEAPPPPGVITIRRSSVRLLKTIVTKPLKAIPPSCQGARMVLSYNFGRTRAYLCDPDLIHEALVRNADSFEKSVEMKRVLANAFGEGLLTADGRIWRRQRHAMAPGFQHDKLQALLPAMIAAAEATRDRLLALPEAASVDVGHEMMHTTFAIILETMLSGRDGIDADSVEHGVTDFLRASTWMFALAMLRTPRWMPFPGRLRVTASTARMRATVRARVATRRCAARARAAAQRREPIDTSSSDLMDMLLAATDPETGRALSDEEIADNILTFIAAGHETTAVALSWTFALLAQHPDCHERLVAEIVAVTGDGPVLPQHVGALTYTRQVVSEAMRLYPPAPIIARATQRDIEIGGVPLAAGTIVFVPIYSVHRHNGLWTRPDAFDPDRFAPEAARARHRFAFMPFGAGPRTCIGSSFALLEAVAILAVLLKNLRLEQIEPMPKPQMRVTLRPKRPIRMRVARR